MVKTIKKQTNNHAWILLKLLIILVWLPTAVMVKVLCDYLDPLVISTLRYSMVSIALLPFFVYACRKHWKVIKKQLWKIVLISIPLSFGGLVHTMAIDVSSATFVSILGLLTPIAFAIGSIFFTRDKISRNAIIGLLFAILGGSIVMILPPLLGHSELSFGIFPILLMAFYIFCDVTWQIARRKQDESKVPMPVILAVPYLVATVIIGTIMSVNVGVEAAIDQIAELPLWGWAMFAYLVVVVSVLAHAWSTKVYEKLGTATTATFDYIYYILAPVVPAVLIGEIFTWEVGIGAGLIIFGIILTRKHYEKRHHHRSHL